MKQGIYIVFDKTTQESIGVINLIGKAPTLEIGNTFDLTSFQEGFVKKLPQETIKKLKEDLFAYELVSLNQFFKRPVLSSGLGFAVPKVGELEEYRKLIHSGGSRIELIRKSMQFNPGKTASDIEVLLHEYGIID